MTHYRRDIRRWRVEEEEEGARRGESHVRHRLLHGIHDLRLNCVHSSCIKLMPRLFAFFFMPLFVRLLRLLHHAHCRLPQNEHKMFACEENS